LIREFKNKPADHDGKSKGPFLPNKEGWNRFVWNLRYPNVSQVNGDDAAAKESIFGAMVPPGTYTIRLTVDGKSKEQTLVIVKDYGIEATDEDLQAQFKLYKAITDKCEQTVQVINQMRSLRSQLDSLKSRLDDEKLAGWVSTLAETVLSIEVMLAVPGLRTGGTDSTNKGERLLSQLAGLPPAVYLGDYRPTVQAQEVFDTISAEIDEQISRFVSFLKTDLSAFNIKAEQANIPLILI